MEEKLQECKRISEYLENSALVSHYNHFIVGVYIVKVASPKFNSSFVLWAETNARHASIQEVRKNVYIIQIDVYGDL